MTQENWAQQAIARFFSRQKHHSQLDFHQLAYDVTGAPFLSEVETPGSMSYTVICTWPEEENHKPEVVSFREEPGAHLDDRIMRVAREMHGCGFVPEMRAVYAPGVPNLKNGLVEGTDPPLKIYIMSYIEGTACLNVLARQVEMDGEQETCHRLFMTDLSFYFARCWLRPQTVLPEALADKLSAVTSRLQFLSASLPPHAQFLSSALPALLTALPRLFTPSYPQVLTHGDLSLTNILVSPRCLAIRGIVDWSLGEILPFGLELDILFLTTGFMDLEGWHNYEYGLRMREAFWENFFSVFARMGWDDAKRALIRREAEAAAKIGAVLRYAFKRNADGSASRELADEGSTGWKYLKAWFGDGCVVEPAQ